MAKRGGKRHNLVREKFRRRTIQKPQRSGLPVLDFCPREGLKVRTFRWGRQELARRDQDPSTTPPGERRRCTP